MPNTVISQMEARMKKALEDLHVDLGTLRTGRATPTLLDKIVLEYYGAPTPMKSLAAVSAPDARQLLVTPFDKSLTNVIANAINKSDLGVSATTDGNNVRVSIPSLNEERRKEMVKLAGKKTEAHKVAVRNIRRDANDVLKKMEKEGAISKDDLARHETAVQKITDANIAEIEKVRAAKEAEILEI
jgi:ribosome recycling factor